jgi:hypothetical protein
MKQFIVILLLCTGGSIMAANGVSKPIRGKATANNGQKAIVKAIKKATPAKKPFCRVCCTVTVFNGTGMAASVESCAGWLLTSCETAATKACDKAEAAAEALLNPGG